MNKSILTIVLLTISLAGCAATSPSHPTASDPTQPRPTPVDYARQYLTLIAPVNTAITTWQAQLKAHPSWTAQQASTAAAPIVTALSTFDSKVLRVSWPATVRPDVVTLVRDDASMAAALSSPLGLIGFTSAAARTGADANVVRADLGLPPPS